MVRRAYSINLVLNEIFVSKVIIDSHYELKHKESINDELIIEILLQMNGFSFEVEDRRQPFSYFSATWQYAGKFYRIVWLLEDNETYVGIINVYRN